MPFRARRAFKSVGGGAARALGFDIPTREENESFRLEKERAGAAQREAIREKSIGEQQAFAGGIGESSMAARASAARQANINTIGRGLKLIKSRHRSRVRPTNIIGRQVMGLMSQAKSGAASAATGGAMSGAM